MGSDPQVTTAPLRRHDGDENPMDFSSLVENMAKAVRRVLERDQLIPER